MLIRGLDHVQLAMPRGGEEDARAFYTGILGLKEIRKPAELRARGGCWFEAGGVQIHLGVEVPFLPALKAHPALLVDDLTAVRLMLQQARISLAEDGSGVSATRAYLSDCFGNRLELIQDGQGFSQGRQQVQARFGSLAQQYVDSPIHAAGDDLRQMLEMARPGGGERMLDVATGGGHTALTFAPHVREVVASDLTPDMLAAAERHIRASGATNVTFVRADAEALPFPDADFDLVTCRIAPHHFPAPERFVIEAARVLRPGGLFIVDDNMAPEDAELDVFMDQFERRRDPTHVAAHPMSRWRAWITAAGLTIDSATELTIKEYEYDIWMGRQGLGQAERDKLEKWILAGPQRCLDYFQVRVSPEGRLVALSGRFGIIAARKVV